MRIDDADVENDAKRMAMDTANSDDERNKRENSDSLDIKRERNESGSSKSEENDTESDTHNGKCLKTFIRVVVLA